MATLTVCLQKHAAHKYHTHRNLQNSSGSYDFFYERRFKNNLLVRFHNNFIIGHVYKVAAYYYTT